MTNSNYRIKKITSENGKVWYMPQKRRSFLFINYWKDILSKVPFDELGFSTKEEAQYEIGVDIIYNSISNDMAKRKIPKNSENIPVTEKEALMIIRNRILK